jgi:HNH endonuclease
MAPFVYPESPHVRRHGPAGYAHYERYRPWLRDEFAFRCVYCLKREQWGVVKAAYHLDHFSAQVHQPQAAFDYDNLLYACATCNISKGKAVIPDPCTCMLDGQVTVGEDGSIYGTTPEAMRLIRKLGLDSPDYCEFRMLIIRIVQLAVAYDPSSFRMLMKYPDNLPNLASLRPPQNTRPEGVHNSFRARRDRGQLPETY